MANKSRIGVFTLPYFFLIGRLFNAFAESQVSASKAVEIEMYVALMDVGELSVIDSTFTVDLFMVSTWNESVEDCQEDLDRLEAEGLYHTKSNFSHALGSISFLMWTPGLEIMESKKMTISDEVNPTVSATLDRSEFYDDHCSYKVKLREQGVIKCNTNFDNYPFDVQSCPLTFRSYTEDESRVKLFWRPKRGDRADQRINLLRMLEYRVDVFHSEFTDVHWSFPLDYSMIEDPLGDYRPFSGVRLELKFSRLLTNMFYNAYLPCILLALVGMCSFFMSLESFAERIILTTSLLLSFYTIYSALSGGLPRATLMTYLDQFLLCCMVFMCLVTLQPVAVHCYLCRLRREAKRRELKSFSEETPVSVVGSPRARVDYEDESHPDLLRSMDRGLTRTSVRSFRHRGQSPLSSEDEVLRKARRFDSMLKYPLIVIMTSYLVSHFVGTYQVDG